TRVMELAALATAREAAGRGFFERFATAREARIGHEVFMGVEWLFARRGLDTHRGAVGQEVPALLVVLEIRHHDLVEHLLVHRGVENRAEYLNPAIEVARHHVGRRDVDRGLAMRQTKADAETINPAVFEKAADDRFHANALGEAKNTRP